MMLSKLYVYALKMNKILQIKKYLLIFISALLLAACDDTLTNEEVNNRPIPDSNVSYAQHIAPIFEIKCVSCHNSSAREGGVDLSSWSAAVSDPRIIFPGSDSTSVLVWTIERRSGFPPMPPVQFPPLTAEQIRGIKTWINEGAKNN